MNSSCAWVSHLPDLEKGTQVSGVKQISLPLLELGDQRKGRAAFLTPMPTSHYVFSHPSQLKCTNSLLRSFQEYLNLF